MGVIWSFLYLLLISFYLLTLFLWDEPFSFLLLPIIILGSLAKGSSYFVKDGFVRESFIFYKWERIKNIDITDERVTVKWKGCVFSGETIVKLDEENITRLKALMLERGVV